MKRLRQVAGINRVTQVRVTGKVAFNQRPEGGEGLGPPNIKGNVISKFWLEE